MTLVFVFSSSNVQTTPEIHIYILHSIMPLGFILRYSNVQTTPEIHISGRLFQPIVQTTPEIHISGRMFQPIYPVDCSNQFECRCVVGVRLSETTLLYSLTIKKHLTLPICIELQRSKPHQFVLHSNVQNHT